MSIEAIESKERQQGVSTGATSVEAEEIGRKDTGHEGKEN